MLDGPVKKQARTLYSKLMSYMPHGEHSWNRWQFVVTFVERVMAYDGKWLGGTQETLEQFLEYWSAREELDMACMELNVRELYIRFMINTAHPDIFFK